MPYNIIKQIDPKYGSLITIDRVDIGEFINPTDAAEKAKSLRIAMVASGSGKVRIFVDGQVMTSNQIGVWAKEEYKSLPKCESCKKILGEDIFTHKLSGTNLFCSSKCSDYDYNYQVDILLDEEDCDYL